MQDPNAKMPEGSQQDPLSVFGRIRERVRRRRESPIDMPEVEDQAAPEITPEKPPKTQAPRSEFEPAPEPTAEPAPALEFPTQRTTRWGGRGNYFYDYTPPSGNTPARIRLHGGPNNNTAGLTITEASHPEAFRAIMDEYNTMSQKGNVLPFVSLQEYRQQAPQNNQSTPVEQAPQNNQSTPVERAASTPTRDAVLNSFAQQFYPTNPRETAGNLALAYQALENGDYDEALRYADLMVAEDPSKRREANAIRQIVTLTRIGRED